MIQCCQNQGILKNTNILSIKQFVHIKDNWLPIQYLQRRRKHTQVTQIIRMETKIDEGTTKQINQMQTTYGLCHHIPRYKTQILFKQHDSSCCLWRSISCQRQCPKSNCRLLYTRSYPPPELSIPQPTLNAPVLMECRALSAVAASAAEAKPEDNSSMDKLYNIFVVFSKL